MSKLVNYLFNIFGNTKSILYLCTINQKYLKMSTKDYSYNEFQELTYEEFYDLVWEDVSEKIVSTSYLDEYEDFVSNLTFDMYRLYQMHNCLTIRLISRMVESFFFHTFRFQPSTNNISEIQDKY